jgi:hypothetical protein
MASQAHGGKWVSLKEIPELSEIDIKPEAGMPYPLETASLR